jgi:hypothetical protein
MGITAVVFLGLIGICVMFGEWNWALGLLGPFLAAAVGVFAFGRVKSE